MYAIRSYYEQYEKAPAKVDGDQQLQGPLDADQVDQGESADGRPQDRSNGVDGQHFADPFADSPFEGDVRGAGQRESHSHEKGRDEHEQERQQKGDIKTHAAHGRGLKDVGEPECERRDIA